MEAIALPEPSVTRDVAHARELAEIVRIAAGVRFGDADRPEALVWRAATLEDHANGCHDDAAIAWLGNEADRLRLVLAECQEVSPIAALAKLEAMDDSINDLDNVPITLLNGLRETLEALAA